MLETVSVNKCTASIRALARASELIPSYCRFPEGMCTFSRVGATSFTEPLLRPNSNLGAVGNRTLVITATVLRTQMATISNPCGRIRNHNEMKAVNEIVRYTKDTTSSTHKHYKK